MTLQAEKTLLVPDQHLGICRAMGLVAAHASLQTDSRMLKSERAPLVRMALHASRLVTKRELELPGLQPSVGLVAVNATDRSFIQLMPIGLRERALNLLVTIETEQVGLVSQQMQRYLGCVNAMAIRTSNLIPSVQAVAPARMGLRSRVTCQASPVHFFDGQALQGKDLRSIACIYMGFTGSMTGLAALILPTLGTADIEYLVRVFAEGLGEFFVARGASGGSHIVVSGRRRWCLRAGVGGLRTTLLAFTHQGQSH
jgi:hypothetical protein